MKKIIINLAIGALFLCLPEIAAAFSGAGSGTPLDPYIITDVNQLQEMKDDLQAWYELANDINAIDTKTWNAGAGFIPVGDIANGFIGHLEGNGFAIWGLYIARPSDNVGLFGAIKGGTIENVGLANADIQAIYPWNQNIGGLVGYNDHGTINNCDFAGNVTGYNGVGGLVGLNSYGSISNCNSAGNVSGSDNVGGLVGHHSYGFITGCSSATIANGGNQCGGLAGYCDHGSIRNSSSTRNVFGNDSVGGLAGSCSFMNISNCSSTGNISGNNSVGGLIGDTTGDTKIVDCHSKGGYVRGHEGVGGLIGSHQGGQIKYCYWTSEAEISGYQNVGGLVGSSTSTITSSYAEGTVRGLYNIGGLAGYNTGSITECFSTATVTTNGDDIGGFVGYNEGSLTNCYATGDVSGSDFVGGFVGENINGTVTNSYSAGSVEGIELVNIGGFAGSSTGDCNACFWDNQTSGLLVSACGTGKTTAEMMQQATFDPPWNFATIWDIDEGQTYPFLQPMQVLPPTCGDAQHPYPAGDLNRDCRINFRDFAVIALHWLECTAPECD
jgi:hypothetical protein